MSKEQFDAVIIGSGPGGYVCAIRCAQLGLKTALIEKAPDLGGTCLNIGCIPSKALLHSTELYHAAASGQDHGLVFDNLRPDLGKLMARKEGVVGQLRKGVETLVAKRGIEIIHGHASFKGKGSIEVKAADGSMRTVAYKSAVVATGSVPVALPFMQPDGTNIITSTEALSLKDIPKSLLVVGAGAIGLELGSVWSRLGSDVTFVEFLPTIAAGSDKDISKLAERAFKKQGMSFHTSTKVTGCEIGSDGVTVTAERKGKTLTFTVEKVLLSVGRKPFTEGLALDKIGIQTDEKGRIPVKNFQTDVEGVYAIGDVIEGPMLAHKAEEDGVAVAGLLAGHPPHIEYERVPGVIYTDPEIASVGMTEEEAKGKGLSIKVGTFPLMANGRAIAQDATTGMAKVIADANTDRILGASLVAHGASEIIGAVTAHMEYGGSAEDLAGTIHAHPTISESLKEAALDVDKQAIHSL